MHRFRRSPSQINSSHASTQNQQTKIGHSKIQIQTQPQTKTVPRRERTNMKPRHAAALALVGWYMMFPPEKCLDKSRNDLGSCPMQYDVTADLWEWLGGPWFPTAEACNAAIARERKLAADLRNQRKVAGAKCVTWKDLRESLHVRWDKGIRNEPLEPWTPSD
jgi:hypothetical protein